MKTIAIFALITLVACDTINPVCHNSVTVSPANPVQFWPVDCQTYNEKEVCGIYHRCYCQPWQCDDEIKIQISDDQGDDFSLVIESELGNEIEEIELTQYTDSSGDIFPDLSEFVNEDLGTSWTTGSSPSVVINTGQSKLLARSISERPSGVYQVTYNVEKPAGDIAFSLSFFDENDNVVGSVSLENGSNVSNVIVTSPFVKFGFRVLDLESGSDTFRVISVEARLLTFSYYASFIPNDLGICDEKILLRIYNTTASPRVEEYRSDCLDIRTQHQCTNLIEYSNNRNYAGLVYTDVSPSPSFQIRVRSVFFHEEFPQEDFVMELTSGIEKTSGVITAQRRFDIDRVPYYMHKKLILIFEHQNILIDGAYWTKQERYEMIDNQRDTFPMKKAQVLLTMRDFVQRSVL